MVEIYSTRSDSRRAGLPTTLSAEPNNKTHNHRKLWRIIKILQNIVNKAAKLYFIGLVFLTATYFVLGGGTADTLSRSQKELWNLGHIAYFFLLLYLIVYLPSLKNVTTKKLIPGLMIFSLILGGLIELSQYTTGRSPDGQDIVRNLIGALLALAFVRGYSNRFQRKLLLPFRIVVLALLAVQISPLARAIIDEIIAYRQFPVLLSNDTPFELDRWRGNAAIEFDRIELTNLLKMRLAPEEQHPGSSLHYLPGDWSEYDTLVIRFYNPSSRSLKLNLKIHDRAHETNYLYRDRFNMNAQLLPGWTDLKISLIDVKNAPLGREMNMHQIRGLSVFTSRLKEQTILYIDKIYLSL
jgi:VanZ family protein